MTSIDSTPIILVLTVGGSPAPLRTAIRENRPARLLLVASDGAGGQASSRDEARSLADGFKAESAAHFASVIETPTDNIGLAFGMVGAALDGLARSHPGHRIIANYTGGTKGMSTALLMAAFQRGHQTQLTTGARADLRQVASGTEGIQDVDTRLIALETELAIALRIAVRGDYAAAEYLIQGLQRRVRDEGLKAGKLAGKLQITYDWARCLAAWDRFDHKTAWDILRKSDGRDWADRLRRDGLADILAELAKGKDDPSPALCQDLQENARRRYRQGRFDDALARLYRFVEACVQAQLFQRWGLKSGELAPDDYPEDLHDGLEPKLNPKLKRDVFEIGLERTVALLRRLDPADPVAAAFDDGGKRAREWLSARNKSILAHGYRAIEGAIVDEAFAWIEAVIAPAMGLKPMAPFPTSPFGSRS
jgi:CRISPR-associated protein (TIGR02710 family)